MIKIAIISTNSYLKQVFAEKIAKEFEEQGKKVKILSETAQDSPFIAIDNMDAHVSWVYSNQTVKELACGFFKDVSISLSCIIEPFALCYVNGIRSDLILRLSHAACLWMNTYDTVVFIKNGSQEPEFSALEAEYCRLIDEFQDSVPISVIQAESIIPWKGKWLNE